MDTLPSYTNCPVTMEFLTALKGPQMLQRYMSACEFLSTFEHITEGELVLPLINMVGTDSEGREIPGEPQHGAKGATIPVLFILAHLHRQPWLYERMTFHALAGIQTWQRTLGIRPILTPEQERELAA